MESLEYVKQAKHLLEAVHPQGYEQSHLDEHDER